MTTVNHQDVGLSASNIAALKLPFKKTAWRLKLQRPTGVKLFDPATAVTENIDDGTHYTEHTEAAKYLKMIADPKHNRTFILHHTSLNSTSAPVISIVNHDLPTTDADYIESVNKSVSTGWPTFYGLSNYPYDMAYNPDKDELAVACSGRLSGATYYQPKLLTINTAKTIAEIEINTCATPKDNPDYLACTALSAPETYWSNNDSAYIKYVRYYKGYYYCWVLAMPQVGTESNTPMWQLVRFGGKYGTFQLLFVYGYPPYSYDDGGPAGNLRADSTEFHTAVRYPTWPRHKTISETTVYPIAGTTAGDFGDKTCGLDNVVSFEIADTGGGQIIMGTSPTSTGPTGESFKFGMEPFVWRISISLMEAELTDASRLIETFQETYAATEVIPGSWGFAGYLEGAFPHDPDLDIVGLNGGGLSHIKMTLSLVPTEDHSHGVISGDLGSVLYWDEKENDLLSFELLTRSFSNFSYGASITASYWCDGFDIDQTNPFSVTIDWSLYKTIPGLVDVIGIHSAEPLCAVADTDRPIVEDGTYATPTTGSPTLNVSVASKAYPASPCLTLGKALYSGGKEKYSMSMYTQTALTGVGLYVYTHKLSPETFAIKRFDNSNSDLLYDYIGDMFMPDDWKLQLVCGNQETFLGDAAAIQFYDLNSDTFGNYDFVATLAWKNSTPLVATTYDYKKNRIGFITASGTAGVGGEIFLYTPPLTDGEWEWDRDIRKWWDGSNPDITMGDNTDGFGTPEHYFTFKNPSFNNSKQNASNQLSFDVADWFYLPWAENSAFNGPLEDQPGVINSSGMLGHGTRIILERGVRNASGYWDWIQEGAFFVEKAPAQAESGCTEMNVSCGGPISLLVTRAVYVGSHKPTETTYTGVTLVSTDDITYHYEVTGTTITDWNTKPTIKIYRDGVDADHLIGDYKEISTAAGTVEFPVAQTGHTIYATFNAYNPGTNEGEDIILCILRYPNDLGGCGLDDSYFTRLLYGETLTTTDNLTYSFSKNNIVSGDAYNKIYRDNVLQVEGVNYTADYRDGTVTFAVSQAGHAITGNAKYYTIQKTGATLQPVYFTPRKQKNSHDAIQEVTRRVAPNYVFREGRDGKLEADFVTQKSAGDEDVVITDADRCLLNITIDPAYEQLATRMISYGQAELDTLPNFCLGCAVTDLWTTEMAAIGQHGWNTGVGDMTKVVDGDEGTGVVTGYGRWDEGTLAVQQYLISTGETGVPVLSIDMTEPKEVETIIVARPSMATGEITTQQMSIWVSNDGTNWTKIVSAFEVAPGANQQFKAGTNFDEGLKFQYIRINAHYLGTYHNTKGNTDSQFGISEVQCYPPTQIEGLAALQDEDPTADLFDYWGLVKKYGYVTSVARSGQPDSTLYTQALADDDAAWCLKEVIRLLAKVTLRSPWLPAIPWGSTIKITNATLRTSQTFFVESHTAGSDGDTFECFTLP